jgi:hypothetical protein
MHTPVCTHNPLLAGEDKLDQTLHPEFLAAAGPAAPAPPVDTTAQKAEAAQKVQQKQKQERQRAKRQWQDYLNAQVILLPKTVWCSMV